MPGRRMRVAIIVLGDLGYSSRMLYHALALADDGAAVDLVGFRGAALPQALREHSRIAVHVVGRPRGAGRDRLRRPWWYVAAAAWTAGMALRLLWTVGVRLERPDHVLVQTPPAVPTLLVAWLLARLRGAALVVDWHNFTYSLIGLRLGPARRTPPLVRLVRGWERVLGRRAAAHLCVSAAMRAELARAWGIDAAVLRDLPAARFAPTPEPARAALRAHVWRLAGVGVGMEVGAEAGAGTEPGGPEPVLAISATSWSADEDLALLFEAAARYDETLRRRDGAAAVASAAPGLVILVTGRGPGREAFEARAAALGLARVRLCTAWFEAEEYPAMLGAADLGISLHRSASGVDLPMKIADMFGAGLPVCALDYGPCLAEMVREGVNGRLFAAGGELGDLLVALADGTAMAAAERERLRAGVAASAGRRWHDEWNDVARPLFAASWRRGVGQETGVAAGRGQRQSS